MASTIRSAAVSSILLFIAVQILLAAHSCSAARSKMMPGETLLAGKSLSAGHYTLTMKEDCNLELRHGKNITWESHTSGLGSKCFLYLEVRGVLVIYSEGASKFIWRSGPTSNPLSSEFVLQPDGNAVLFATTNLWSTALSGEIMKT
ncbi:hypothetical protein KSP39_PZI013426 [Platanthera zijinensis]|uniref:Bulb-type lectin domain-containing protein n=1 Tax=Platanthera zijinensis TaxID=2320716 RepID=A0AAP0G3T4_9ASPA